MPIDIAPQETAATRSNAPVINDFSIQVATVNGSGSQTANLVLLRSILLMGVPVSGKNMVRRGSVSFYFPLATSIVISIVLTLLMIFFRR